ncbi:MAG: PstS family phosphate ABC transporter substrate-binding protein [Gemmatimonadota bacterium]|nr:PstS family phosphate ABC transporter substrate-binding protein [Gemmatimonadota bacterium]
MNRQMRWFLAAGVLASMVTGCGREAQLILNIDGSSTVYPITEAVAEEFASETHGATRVIVAVSGTGGGFRRFCAGETDISNASRVISETEIANCAAAGVEFLELPVAMDGLSVVVHSSNDFVECLTIDELRRIWEPESKVQLWSDVRAGWPARPIRLYGPGTNSGTFDYFTEEVTGKVGASRSDYTASEDDNVLVQGVSGDVNSLGYFGYAYFVENREGMKLLGVDEGAGCVTPSPVTIENGSYSPLSRPLLIYVNRASLARPEVREFVEYYISTASRVADEVGYVPLSTSASSVSERRLREALDAL